MTEPLVSLVVQHFVARREAKALQLPDGTYDSIRRPWAKQDFLDHLSGKKTWGHYLLNADSRCKFFAFDIDLRDTGYYVPLKHLEELTPEELDQETPDEPIACQPRHDFLVPDHPCRRYLTWQLNWLSYGLALRIERVLGLHTMISYSGSKGVHVYGMTGLIPAKDARSFAHLILKDAGFEETKGNQFFGSPAWPNVEIEAFPKQDHLEDETKLGNLMRLPLGIHRKSNSRSFFLSQVDTFYEFTEMPFEEALTRQPWEKRVDGADPGTTGG